jgi:uncharacterized protein (TIGR02757 family)
MGGAYRSLRGRASGACIHRTFFEDDLAYYCRGLRACYKNYGSLEALFGSALGRPGSDGAAPNGAGSEDGAENGGIWDAMALFRETMAGANGGRYTKHIADPYSGSPCKRLCLSLRWLVRRDGPVDLGLWKSILPSALCIPLDLHVGRAARQLGLLDPARQANDRKAAVSLTGQLRELCPEDPARYDLALFGWGMENGKK